MADTSRMSDRVRDRDRPTVRQPKEGEPLQPGRIDDGLQVRYPGVEGETRDVAVGQPRPPLVIPQQRAAIGEALKPGAPQRTVPVVLHVVDPPAVRLGQSAVAPLA